MRLRRGAFVLAIVAALWGAPSLVSAAENEISSPQVLPGRGCLTTVFTFRGRHEGGCGAAPAVLTVAGVTAPMVLESTRPRDDSAATDEMVADILLLGVAGVASVAIVGTLLLVAGRRREPARAEASRAPSLAEDAPGRRMVRTGRAQPSDDPIIAALGVDDEMAARRAIRRAGRASRAGRPGKGPKVR